MQIHLTSEMFTDVVRGLCSGLPQNVWKPKAGKSSKVQIQIQIWSSFQIQIQIHPSKKAQIQIQIHLDLKNCLNPDLDLPTIGENIMTNTVATPIWPFHACLKAYNLLDQVY